MIWLLWLLLIPVALLTALFVIDFQISAPAHKGPESDHFNGRIFLNPDDPSKSRSRGLFAMIKWAFTGDRGEWTWLSEKDTKFSFPEQQPVDPSEIVITFINHSTFLVQAGTLNMLTDPIWSERASPYNWIGPKRMRPPGVRFGDLPSIDLVLLSHNHYDHLDLPTILQLKTDHHPLFITPLGVGRFLNRHQITQTVELDWWNRYEMDSNVTITSVPARHFSGRGIFDRDQTLWCGYVLQICGQTLYFAGDTAYGSFFTDIGEAFDIDLSIIPIGAYKPRWFMQPIHANPADAVQIHKDVQSFRSIASHFGTFPMADDAMKEPPEDLSKALDNCGLIEADFQILEEGESCRFKNVCQRHPSSGEF
jgi:L-ascorbate metabolism protein UlaG (beta-lactamase superfamily)